MTELTEIIVASDDGALMDKSKTQLIRCPIGKTMYAILESVISITDFALYGCKNLKDITIPNSVTKIGKYAFSEGRGLTDVYYGGNDG